MPASRLRVNPPRHTKGTCSMSKAKSLSRLARDFRVPPFVVLDAGALEKLWIDFPSVWHSISAIGSDIELTAAGTLDKHLADLERAATPKWRDDWITTLSRLLERVGLSVNGRFAVRSSARVEDGQKSSFAGIFTTELNITGLEAIRRAVESVWLSSFRRAGVIERIKSGVNLKSADSWGMEVVLQQMLAPEYAGVCFTRHPITGADEIYVEFVAGLADGLVSGEKPGKTVVVGSNNKVSMKSDADAAMIQGVVELAKRVEKELGGPCDLEWAYAAKDIWLLQARPITTTPEASGVGRSTPLFQIAKLYGADAKELTQFFPLPSFAKYFREKRKPLYEFGEQHGASPGGAWLIKANKEGLATSAAARWFDAITAEKVVVDVSESIRQRITSSQCLTSQLVEMLPDTPLTFVVREFITGNYGLISKATSTETAGSVVTVELSDDGLLAINRGMARTSRFQLQRQTADNDEITVSPRLAWPLNAVDTGTIYDASLDANETLGPSQLEWVLNADELHLIDYSNIGKHDTSREFRNKTTISAGIAEGSVLHIKNSRSLVDHSTSAAVSIDNVPPPDQLGTSISEIYGQIKASPDKVILVVDHPYAALAPLIPYVSGFVFRCGSLLCHLAILLREHGVPAIELGSEIDSLREGEVMTIEAY